MLMQCSFKFLANIEAILSMTDMDSIVFMATKEMWEHYEATFVPIQKTVGGWIWNLVGIRLITIGPMKYVCFHQRKQRL